MSTNHSEYILEVNDLHTSFTTDSGEVKAVNGVSFNLKPGEIMGKAACSRTHGIKSIDLQ